MRVFDLRTPHVFLSHTNEAVAGKAEMRNCGMAVRPRRLVTTNLHGERRHLRFEQLEDRRLLSLSHLYTFNDGLANDWIGSAHATLFNGATIAGGQLILANGNLTSGAAGVQHARLGTNALPSGDATIAVWFTANNLPAGARLFDIGTQFAGAGEANIALVPDAGAASSLAQLRPTGVAEIAVGGTEVDDGLEYMATLVIDTGAGLFRLYLDGAEAASAPLDGATASSVNDAIAFVGRSLTGADPAFTGSINELRIYDHAQSAAEIAADATSGPSTLTKSPLVRQMEYLDRGTVVVRRSSTEAYVGWRLLGTDPTGIAFNVYRSAGGATAVKLNASPITASTNYVDSTANFNVSNAYFVRSIFDGVEHDAIQTFTLAALAPVQQYLNVPIQPPPGATIQLPPGVAGDPGSHSYTYTANDTSVGDLDGDGQYEIILKWDPFNPEDVDDPDNTPPRVGEGSSKDNSQSGFTGNVFVDAYKLDGTRLWRIDLGRNIRAGAHYTQLSVYDLDGDGKAEVVLKTAPGTIDGKGYKIFLGTDNPDADYRNSSGYILSGPEYLTVFNGETGKATTTVPYQPARGSVTQWGDSYGNRVDRFTSGIAYLDGVHPSVIVGRGYYGPQSGGGQSRNEIAAYDFRDGQLTLRWTFKAGLNINGNINSNYIGQGAHSLTIGDVDGDGNDEIIYGAAAIDDNGLGLYSTGLGHGDALHLSDMDPNRPGLEVFMVHESPGSYQSGGRNAGGEFRDARTGQLIFQIPATNDVGRGVAADIDPNSPGCEMWALTTDPNGGPRYIYGAAGQQLYPMPSNMFTNFVVWWDADLTRELLDGTTISEWNSPGRSNFDLNPGQSGTQQFAPNASSNNGTKSTPALSADILGDWREEVIWRRSDNTALEIFTTSIVASNRLYTLMHDSQYRESIAAQNSAYNQPPHPSFFLGAGMAAPPTPQIYTVQYVPPVDGDFNGDHAVDATDYTIWRDTLGSTSDLRADGDGDEIIGPGDYDVWRLNFGAQGSGPIITNSTNSGSGSASGGGSTSTLEIVASNQLSSDTLTAGGASLDPFTDLIEGGPARPSLLAIRPTLATSSATSSTTETADLLFELLDAASEGAHPSATKIGDLPSDSTADAPQTVAVAWDTWSDLEGSPLRFGPPTA
jgi:rhamnogalacturonan endolyase